MVEDYGALEEEGVTGLQKGKYVLREVTALFMQFLVYPPASQSLEPSNILVDV